jgi:uncharacterized membrane protein YeaQ/YmgE (transglycosylase-associated protein family)
MSKVVRVVGGVVGAVIGGWLHQPWLVKASIALHLGGVQEMLLTKPRISDPGDALREPKTP